MYGLGVNLLPPSDNSLSHKSSENVSFKLDKNTLAKLRREAEQNKLA
jgi:hypothetical protein